MSIPEIKNPEFINVEESEFWEFIKNFPKKLGANEKLEVHACGISVPTTIFYFIDKPDLKDYFHTTIGRRWDTKEIKPQIRKDLWESK